MSSTGAAAPAKKKRVRKQKTEVEQEAAAEAREHQQAEVEAEEAAAAAAAPAKKKVKREAKAAAAAPSTARGPEEATGDQAQDDGALAVKKDTAIAGAGYLSQETLNYYKQLAAVLDKDDFEDAEDKQTFLTNVVEELCGAEAGKVRATTRRGVAGEAEDAMDESEGGGSGDAAHGQQQNTTNPAFVLQRLCSHAKCSHLVQKIMEIATPAQVAMFLTALQENVVEVLSDRYGSHVLESVFFRLPALLAAEAAQVDSTEKDAIFRAQQASAAKSQQAWRNLGTHSYNSVADSGAGPQAKRTPLRAHLFTLVGRLIPDGRWLELAKDAHAAYAMRHVVNVLAGETNLKALADAAAGVKAPGSATAAAAAAAAAPTSLASLVFSSHLGGLEELLPWLVQEISATPADELEEASRNPSAAPFLQAVLKACDRTARALGDDGTDDQTEQPTRTHMRSLMSRLLQFDGGASADQWTPEHVTQAKKNSVFLFMCDRSGSRLFETICAVGSPSLLSALFTCHFATRVLELARHQIANFALQHLLQSVQVGWRSKGRHLLRAAYDELSPEFASLASSSRTGVLLQLLDACVRVGVKEQKVFKLLAQLAIDSFDEPTPITSNPVGALLLTPIFKAALADKESVGVIGALMVQSCLLPGRGLQKSTTTAGDAGLASSQPFVTVLNSFLALPSEFLLRLALDPAGSHLFDAFTQSPCTLAIKQQVLRRFQMKWVDLCLSPSGSFVLERLFELAPQQLKVGIAGDLVRAEKRVLASRSGAMVYRKLRLEHYKRHQPSWLHSRDAAKGRASAMFADVIGETDTAATTKKKDASSTAAAKGGEAKPSKVKAEKGGKSDSGDAPKKVKQESKQAAAPMEE